MIDTIQVPRAGVRSPGMVHGCLKSSHGLWLLSWIRSVIQVRFLKAACDDKHSTNVEQLPSYPRHVQRCGFKTIPLTTSCQAAFSILQSAVQSCHLKLNFLQAMRNSSSTNRVCTKLSYDIFYQQNIKDLDCWGTS